MQAVLRAVPHVDAFAEAKTSALSALALDSRSADAHVALGTVQFLHEWDWTSATHSFERALDINSDLTEALLQYGSLCDALGRLDEGLRLKQRALARDPTSPLVLVHIALSHAHQRRYDDALAWSTRALELNPTHLLAGVFVAFVYWSTGDIERFIAHTSRMATARGTAGAVLESMNNAFADMRRVHAARGLAGWSECMAQQLAGADSDGYGAPATAAQRAMLYGAAGRLQEAFACLDDAVAVRDPAMVYLAVGPQWDPLRADSRFRRHLRAIFPHTMNA